MNDRGKQLWREVLARDVLVPATDEEYAALKARMTGMARRLLTWEGSDGEVAMPTISEVCDLAADIARYNTRTMLAELAGGGGPGLLMTLDMT